MRNLMWTRIGLLGLLAFLTVSASAAEIWTDIANPADNNRNYIAKLDSHTCGIEWVGPTDANAAMDGMDFAANGTLYGVSDRSFYWIDQQMGGWPHAHYIDEIIPPGDPNNVEIFFDLSWDPLTQTMFGVASKSGQLELYTINLDNAHGTLYGVIKGYNALFPPGGLATTAEGVRYIDDHNRLYRLDAVDPNGEVWAEPGRVEAFNYWWFGGMTIDWRGDGLLYHLTVNSDTLRTQLWLEDVTDGSGTCLCDAVGYPTTIALSAAILPEPGGLLLLAVAAVCVCRRRRGVG